MRCRFTSEGGPSRASTTGRAIGLGERHTRFGGPVCRSDWGVEVLECKIGTSARDDFVQAWLKSRHNLLNAIPLQRPGRAPAGSGVPQAEVSSLWLGAPLQGEGYL